MNYLWKQRLFIPYENKCQLRRNKKRLRRETERESMMARVNKQSLRTLEWQKKSDLNSKLDSPDIRLDIEALHCPFRKSFPGLF